MAPMVTTKTTSRIGKRLCGLKKALPIRPISNQSGKNQATMACTVSRAVDRIDFAAPDAPPANAREAPLANRPTNLIVAGRTLVTSVSVASHAAEPMLFTALETPRADQPTNRFVVGKTLSTATFAASRAVSRLISANRDTTTENRSINRILLTFLPFGRRFVHQMVNGPMSKSLRILIGFEPIGIECFLLLVIFITSLPFKLLMVFR